MAGASLDADCIVIGSGSGGLTAAVALAQAGEKVLVLEQHEVPGGWCHSFRRGGYHFSPGVHYVGECQAGGTTAEIYEGLGVADDLEFFEINPDGFEHCHIAGSRFDYCRGPDRLLERFQRQFPADAAGLAEFFELAGNVHRQIPLARDVRTFTDFLKVPYRTRHLGRYGLYSLHSILQRHIRNPLVRAVLSAQAGDHGLPPRLAPFALHCGVMGHYFNGGYYPAGGGISIPLALRKSLRKHGGEIQLKARVRRILLDKTARKRRAIGVELADGRQLRAKRLFSNADPGQTFSQMIGEENLSGRLRRRLRKTRYSLPALSLFLAIDTDPRKLGLDSGNFWYLPTDLDAAYQRTLSPRLFERDELEGLFVTAHSLKDPTQYNGRHHTLEAVTFVGYQAFRAFEASHPDTRPAEYLTLKEKITRMMLRTLERAVPGLSRHLVFCELGTPVTSRHFLNATEGACYGTEKSRFQMGPFSFRNRTEIEGLFLCGASTSAHGVSGAANSGLDAAEIALGCERKDILKNRSQRMRTYSAEDPSTWPASVHERIARNRARRVSERPHEGAVIT